MPAGARLARRSCAPCLVQRQALLQLRRQLSAGWLRSRGRSGARRSARPRVLAPTGVSGADLARSDVSAWSPRLSSGSRSFAGELGSVIAPMCWASQWAILMTSGSSGTSPLVCTCSAARCAANSQRPSSASAAARSRGQPRESALGTRGYFWCALSPCSAQPAAASGVWRMDTELMQ